MTVNGGTVIERFKEFLSMNPIRVTSQQDPNIKRQLLDINEIRKYDKELADKILQEPESSISLIEDELNSNVGFTGAMGSHHLTPRTVSSMYVSKLVSVEGIITSSSAVRPKIKKSVHYDEYKKVLYEKDYRDSTMISSGSSKLPMTDTVFPTHYESRPIRPEYGLSTYIDFQTAVIQEMPENSPAGQLPRSIDCIFSEDLVDLIKPGDRVRLVGIFKPLVGLHKGLEVPNRFRTVLIVNNIISYTTSQSYVYSPDGGYFNHNTIDISKLSLNNSLTESEDPNMNIRLLAESDLKWKCIAPTIFGHSNIKKALALQLVGGNEIIMSNGSKIRGDINILLVGDPSTAKSQLLRYILKVSDLSVATTGRGSTGVGLTAAVVLDKDTKEKRLEAGAMVLADRGVCCIDEFDKLSDEDRVAIHEVMEQQTISISKAGIHTTLNARCSVLAAANPHYGSYNQFASIKENIRLPESLLSRFDLIFITLDNKNICDGNQCISGLDLDTHISSHVLSNHSPSDNNADESLDDATENPLVSQKLFKAYIKLAKELRPKLTPEASQFICNAYADIRKEKKELKKEYVISISPRVLETLIRLATAFAKLRLSSLVEVIDAEDALNLVNENKSLSLYKMTVLNKSKVDSNNDKVVTFKEEVAIRDLSESHNATDDRANKENASVNNNLIVEPAVRDQILEAIWDFKEHNENMNICNIGDIVNKKFSIDEIREVVKELAAQDIIMFEDDCIYFLD